MVEVENILCGKILHFASVMTLCSTLDRLFNIHSQTGDVYKNKVVIGFNFVSWHNHYFCCLSSFGGYKTNKNEI